MTSTHPVQFRAEGSPRRARISVIIRLALLIAIGLVGCGAIYWLLYFSIPALVALVVLQRGPAHYSQEIAPRIVRVLRWLAGAYAYLWMLTELLPTADPGGPVDLEVELTAAPPTAASCLLRIVYSLPALLLAAVLSLAAAILWLVAAIAILITERMPGAIADFLALTLRYQSRLAAYHLSLVDRYPSLQESSLAQAPI